MFRSLWIAPLALCVVIAGCKPSVAPREDDEKEPKGQSIVTPPPTRQKAPKPYQAPITGSPDLEVADHGQLVQSLGHEDTAVRLEAADRLASQGSQAIPLLIEALDDENYHVRAGAVYSLGLLGPAAKSALPKLEELAEEDQWEAVRDAAKFARHAISEE